MSREPRTAARAGRSARAPASARARARSDARASFGAHAPAPSQTCHGDRVAVVVPAYNEERLIARTLRAIPPFVQHVVVVDDASSDRTAQLAAALGDARVEVVRHARNRGVGAAIVTGYRAAFARGADVCAVMAGDAQMDPADLRTLVAPVLRGDADYAKGDRLSYPHARQHMPLTRWLGNGVLGWATQLATGLRIRDAQCGYTALSARAAARLPLERLWPRYGYPNDLLGMLAERRIAVREVTVRPIYADEASGIGLRHALLVIPFVLARVLARRLLRALGSRHAGPAQTEAAQREAAEEGAFTARPRSSAGDQRGAQRSDVLRSLTSRAVRSIPEDGAHFAHAALEPETE